MPQPQQRLASIEELVHKIEAVADPAVRTAAQELVQAVMDLHGAGIGKILELVGASGDPGEKILEKLGGDELVASLLVLHGLHPVDLETRLAQALDKAGSRLRSHGAEVELISLQDGEARLRLRANGHGCGSTFEALKPEVEAAVYQAAPDITALVIEGEDRKQSFVPLEMLQGAV